MNINKFGITPLQIRNAQEEVKLAMKRKNVAKFKDEESEKLFYKIATFWLCIPLITGFRVRLSDQYELSKAEKFLIDFDRDEDHEEVAFPELVFKLGNCSCSVIEIEPYQENDEQFQAVLTEKMANKLLNDLDFIQIVDVKDEFASLFNLKIKENV